MRGVERVDIGVVETTLFGVRRSLDEIMYLPTNLGLVEINLNILSVADLVVLVTQDAYGNQAVARQQSGPGA